MSARIAILLSGYLASGKDTVGAFLSAYGFRRYAFADALKDEVAELYDLDRAALDTQEGKQQQVSITGKPHMSARTLLITHGQMRRTENVNYWVEKVATRILADKCHRVVITDWRFPNEHACLLKLLDDIDDIDNLNWNINTLRINRWEQPPLRDDSELALDSFPFDTIIDNRASVTIAKLKRSVDEFVWTSVAAIRWLIMDVDDVLLDWIAGFRHHLVQLGYKTHGDLPPSWDLSDWIVPSVGFQPVSVETLVLDFNSSDSFAQLQPVNGALRTLMLAKSRGFDIVAVTSCSDTGPIVDKRVANLREHFADLISSVVCLPLGASKTSIFRNFPNGIVVDDRVKNLKAALEVGLNTVLFCPPWMSDLDWKQSVSDHESLQKWLDSVSASVSVSV